jgi:hypothetical protein
VPAGAAREGPRPAVLGQLVAPAEAGEEDILPDPYAVEEGAVYAASPKTLERNRSDHVQAT